MIKGCSCGYLEAEEIRSGTRCRKCGDVKETQRIHELEKEKEADIAEREKEYEERSDIIKKLRLENNAWMEAFGKFDISLANAGYIKKANDAISLIDKIRQSMLWALLANHDLQLSIVEDYVKQIDEVVEKG